MFKLSLLNILLIVSIFLLTYMSPATLEYEQESNSIDISIENFQNHTQNNDNDNDNMYSTKKKETKKTSTEECIKTRSTFTPTSLQEYNLGPESRKPISFKKLSPNGLNL